MKRLMQTIGCCKCISFIVVLLALAMNQNIWGASQQGDQTFNLPLSYWELKVGISMVRTPYTGTYESMKDDYADYRPFYTIGVLYNHRIYESLFLQVGLLYAPKGSFYKFPTSSPETDSPISQKLSLRYLEIPFVVKYVVYSRSIKPAVVIGLYGARLLQFDKYTKAYGEWVKQPESYQRYKKDDFGPLFGVDAHFDSYGGIVTLEARYSFSFGNIINEKYWAPGVSYRNRSIALLVGITL